MRDNRRTGRPRVGDDVIMKLLIEGKTPREIRDATGFGLTKIYVVRRSVPESMLRQAEKRAEQ